MKYLKFYQGIGYCTYVNVVGGLLWKGMLIPFCHNCPKVVVP